MRGALRGASLPGALPLAAAGQQRARAACLQLAQFQRLQPRPFSCSRHCYPPTPRPPLPTAKDAMSALACTTLRRHPTRPMRITRGSARSSGGNIMYVASLPILLKPRQVWEAFIQFGEILALEVPLSDTDPMQIMGFAYVQFASARSMEEAVPVINGMDLLGTKIRAEVCKEPSASEQLCTAVYVENLSLSWTREHLLARFARFGVITSAELVQTPGYPECSGCVKFATQDSLNAAIEGTKDKWWEGLEVRPAALQASVGGSGAAAADAGAGGAMGQPQAAAAPLPELAAAQWPELFVCGASPSPSSHFCGARAL